MGNISSVFFKGMFEDAQEEAITFADNSVATRPRTPIPTHKHRQLVNDPRSPTEEVSRTPIEVECFSQKSMPCSAIINEFDPRSPTIGIFRTPIQVGPYSTANTPQEEVYNESDLECKRYLETNLDDLVKDEYDVEDLTADLQHLAASLDLDQSGFVASPAAAELSDEKLIEKTSTPSEGLDALFKLAPVLTDGPESPIVMNSKEKKLIETPPGRKGIRKRNNKENGIPRQPLSKSDKLPAVAKVRTPLGTVSSRNQSPLHIVRGKQCQVLRQKLAATSNTEEQGKTAFGN